MVLERLCAWFLFSLLLLILVMGYPLLSYSLSLEEPTLVAIAGPEEVIWRAKGGPEFP